MSIMDFLRRKKTSESEKEEFSEPTGKKEVQPTTPSQVESAQYIDLGLTSGTLWADRNAGAEGVYKLGILYDKASAPGKLPTYDQCAELINECKFSSYLVPDENNIMKNFIQLVGPNGNSIFFPCIRSKEDETEIGAYCWCDKEMKEDYSCLMMFQERLLGILDFAQITNLTIGITLKSGKMMVRNVK